MRVEKDKVVAFDYTLKGDDGNVIDSSEGGTPLYYLHGHNNIVPGLEAELEGKQEGDAFEVAVPPDKGYGERSDDAVFEVPKSQLPSHITPQKGMQLNMTTEGGHNVPVRIKAVKINTVIVDGNHELAGQTLHFAVTVRNIRDANKEELSHGHVHGPDGHHHH